MVTFEQIQKANEGLSTVNMKDKPYVMVPQRVMAFRKLFPEGFIVTDILSNENGVVLMKTEVGYYDGDRKVVLGTGMAYEKESSNFINKTSYIENCETSSVGRALGFLALGIDGGGVCSAEELVNAIRNQKDNAVRLLPVENDEQPKEKMIDLAEIRTKLDAAIKAKTKDMSKAEKIRFVNEVVMTTLQGERNWKLCRDEKLLTALLVTIETKVA